MVLLIDFAGECSTLGIYKVRLVLDSVPLPSVGRGSHQIESAGRGVIMRPPFPQMRQAPVLPAIPESDACGLPPNG